MSTSRDIGTRFTTDVIRYLAVNGWPKAELRNPAGSRDKGDIVGLPRLVIECKGGEQAEEAGDALVAKWLDETETERLNAGAELGVLVMKRAGYGAKRAGEWWAVMPVGSLVYVSPDAQVNGQPLRMHLRTAVALLHAAGYGNEQS